MKRIFSLALIAMQIFAVSCKAEDGKYIINGNVEKGGNGAMLYLFEMGDDLSFTCTDSAKVADGKFTFKGSIKTSVEVRILGANRNMGLRESNLCRLYVEPAEMALTVPSTDALKGSKLSGSKTQDEVDDYNATIKEVYEPLMKLNDQFYEVRAKGDTVTLAKIENDMRVMGEKFRTLSDGWMEAHPDAFLTYQEKSRGVSDMTLEQVEALLASFPEKLKGTEPYNAVAKELNNLKKCAPGAVASDFTSTDINGKQFTFSSLKGHYVILDFWASWCVPCRKSMPHVKSLYAKYKDKGLEVVCVASDDGAEAKWRKAVADDATEMFHHVLTGMKQKADGSYDKSQDIGENYAVHYLPTKFLINPEGVIIDKFDDKELDAKLQEIYGF